MASLDSELDLGQITVVTHEPANPSSPPTTTGRDPVPSAEMSGSNVTFSNVEEPRSSTNNEVPTAYQQYIQQWKDTQKPVKEKNLKVYRLISILAIIAFFPTGVPAFYFALKLKEDFYEGIEIGDMSKCIKRAQLLDRLLIISFTLCVFLVILILAIVGGVEGRENKGVHL